MGRKAIKQTNSAIAETKVVWGVINIKILGLFQNAEIIL
jgi:hypothetical protein